MNTFLLIWTGIISLSAGLCLLSEIILLLLDPSGKLDLTIKKIQGYCYLVSIILIAIGAVGIIPIFTITLI